VSLGRILTLACMAAASCLAASSPFAGRWDLTMVASDATYPSWMEFAEEGPAGVVRLVGRTGSVHPASDVKVQGSHLTFKSPDGTWDITVSGHKLSGVRHVAKGGDVQLSGVPAPALKRPVPAAWSAPEPLFDGKDLKGWEVDDPSKTYWSAQNGELRNDQGGANIHTTRKLQDFKLHIEYNCPQGGNSGVYLRGRYEVQVEYEPPEKNDQFHAMGSIYGFIAPSAQLPKIPGQWETYDVTLVGRTVTVIRDGTKIIDEQEIPGITGGALDSREAEPGPLYLQGDHTGGLRYRNITVSLPK
jgi:3-keto-disaccharide hydrolase